MFNTYGRIVSEFTGNREKFMIKRYILGLFLVVSVAFCNETEVSLQDMLKSLEGQKVKADEEVKASRQAVEDLKARNAELRKQFLDNKRSLLPETFKFADEATSAKRAELEAQLKRLDEERSKVMSQIEDLMNSDPEYKKLNDESNDQLKELQGMRERKNEVNMRLTEAIKNQRIVDEKISEIKKQIEAENKIQDGDKE